MRSFLSDAYTAVYSPGPSKRILKPDPEAVLRPFGIK